MSTPDDRLLELELEVPGTPEQVWAAIATGPGISSWIHPTTVEEREGGTFTFDMGDGPQSGTVTVWDPPYRLRQETTWGTDAMVPTTLATEWIVETRSGGTCVVRMVTSGFRSGDSWDDEFDGFTESMTTSLENLRLYLTAFPGRSGRWLQVFGTPAGKRDLAWRELLDALGVADAAEGDAVTTTGPGLSGTVERLADARWRHDLQLTLDAPAPGLATLSAWGTDATIAITASLFDVDETTVEQLRADWQVWLDAHLGEPG